jgi:Uma2 family endonuclease
MAMPVAAHKWTIDERDALPDDLRRREILHGELLVTPAPGAAHQRLVSRLNRALEDYVAVHRIGTVLLAPYDIVWSPHLVLEPDLLVVPAKETELGRRWAGKVPPTLVIEVVSASSRRRDYRAKRDFYAAGNVRECWIVDLAKRQVTVVRPGTADQQFTTRLEWQPAGADVPFSLDIVALFSALPAA